MLFLLLPAVAAPSLVSRGGYDRVASAGDVNGDGFADVVVSNCSTGVVDLYLGSRDGLVLGASVVAGGCELAGVGDLDGDGADEILVGDPDANGGDGVISLYRGAALSFWKRRYGSGGEHLGEQVAGIGDINGDGVDDFAATSWISPGGTAGLNRVSVWQSADDSAPTWTWEETLDPTVYTDSGPARIAHADTDGDGIQDLLVLTSNKKKGWTRTLQVLTGGTVVQTVTGGTGGTEAIQLVAGTTELGMTIRSSDDGTVAYTYDLASGQETTGWSGYGAMDMGDPDGDGVDTLYEVLEESACYDQCTIWEVTLDHAGYDSVEVGSQAIPKAVGDVNGDGLGDFVVLDGELMFIPAYLDADCDGVEAGAIYGLDCDDSDAMVYPGATDVIGDGLDSDCDGEDSFDLALPPTSPRFTTSAEARALLVVPFGLPSATDLANLEALATRTSFPLLTLDDRVYDDAYFDMDEQRWMVHQSDLDQEGVDAEGVEVRHDQDWMTDVDYLNPRTSGDKHSSTVQLKLEGTPDSDPSGGTINRSTSRWSQSGNSKDDLSAWYYLGSEQTEWGTIRWADGTRASYENSSKSSKSAGTDGQGNPSNETVTSLAIAARDASLAISFSASSSQSSSSIGGLSTDEKVVSVSVLHQSASNTTTVNSFEIETTTTDSAIPLTTVEYTYVGSASDGNHLLTIENNNTVRVCGRSLWEIFSGDPTVPEKSVGWATLDGNGFLVEMANWQAITGPDIDGDGWVAGYGDCNDAESRENPCEIEVLVDGLDNDCDGIAVGDDRDADGFLDEDDCAPLDNLRNPGEPELCDGIDNDCDGEVDLDPVEGIPYFADADFDGYGNANAPALLFSCTSPLGYSTSNTDCNDRNFAVSPESPEICDRVDNNCDGRVDVGLTSGTYYYPDKDQDGYYQEGQGGAFYDACTPPPGTSDEDGDCDDTNADVRPGALEVCDGIDNDCNRTVDKPLDVFLVVYTDADGDGFGNAAYSRTLPDCTMPDGNTVDSTDCDDEHRTIHPGADEVCNGVDQDCDGESCEPACGCSQQGTALPGAALLLALGLVRRRRMSGFSVES